MKFNNISKSVPSNKSSTLLLFAKDPSSKKKPSDLSRGMGKKRKVVHVEKLKLRVERFSLKIGAPTTKTHRVKKLDYLIVLHALSPSSVSPCL